MTSVDNAPSPGAGIPRPTTMGRFLYVGDRKIEVRGVTYGTFRPDEQGVPYPEPCIVRLDFSRMAAAGFNAVRVYTPPPMWLLDEAGQAGLRVLVGLPWEQHVAYLDQPHVLRHAEARVRHGARRCRGHPALLCYSVANEIPAGIVRWLGRRRVERHLRRLFEIVKTEDPGALVTYVNYPSTEYLDLPFLDLVAFNVFLDSAAALEAYIARLHNLAGDRPLLLTELGRDSRHHGVGAQARLVEDQLRVVRDGGCSGSFVFSWTDEWHRGGWDVTDWDFGLTTRDRRPKPALAAASRALVRRPTPRDGRWPRFSVIVCVHNGARWIADCLDGCTGLDYSDYEVVVVDNGSSDATSEIVRAYDVRLIRTGPSGLSAARNAGLDAADGEIVAYVDADARPDPDWLIHLALAFGSSDFVGVGGPNIPPRGDGPMAACVANAPGGPLHVLLGDREADHIPGCNMAFRKVALEVIGGFDPMFRIAGDDVDVCWRLQARGGKLGFAPAAVVWHHPRDSIRDFWRQQQGYGAAEALLEAKWPEKYNAAGHVTWRGRVYGPPSVTMPGCRSRVYHGTWGEAAYQHLEPSPSGLIWATAVMPEWYLALLVLAGLSWLGMLWPPLLAAVPLLVLGVSVTLARAVRGAARARFADEPRTEAELRARRRLVALLHLIQPAARLTGRLLTGLVPWRVRARARSPKWPPVRNIETWRLHGEPASRTLERVERSLDRVGSAARRGGGYDRWDVQVDGGSLGFARLLSCAEDHGQGRQLFRAKIRARFTGLALFVVVGGGGLATWAAVDGAPLVGVILGAAVGLVATRAFWECASSRAALSEAVLEAERNLASESPTRPSTATSARVAAGPPRRAASLRAG